MKLGEALAERAALKRHIAELRDRIDASRTTQEGVEPDEDPMALIADLTHATDSLRDLTIRINRTNADVQMPGDGRSLMRALAEREALGSKHGSLMRALQTGGRRDPYRYMRSELKFVKHLDVPALQAEADKLAKDRRELDVQIQQANWDHDLLA